jgi:hypothetical protein
MRAVVALILLLIYLVTLRGNALRVMLGATYWPVGGFFFTPSNLNPSFFSNALPKSS